jgi:hypothetical protein
MRLSGDFTCIAHATGDGDTFGESLIERAVLLSVIHDCFDNHNVIEVVSKINSIIAELPDKPFPGTAVKNSSNSLLKNSVCVLRPAQHERKTSVPSIITPFVLRLSMDERRVFQQTAKGELM